MWAIEYSVLTRIQYSGQDKSSFDMAIGQTVISCAPHMLVDARHTLFLFLLDFYSIFFLPSL